MPTAFTRRLYLLLLVITVMLCACKTQKHVIPEELPDIDIDSIYLRLFDKQEINWFAGKAKVRIEDNSGTTKGLMYVRMKSDSMIWMVFKKLSIEAARVKITRDSIVILNRIDKTVQSARLDSISNLFGLSADFEFLSEILIGRLPAIDTSVLWKEKQTDTHYMFRSMVGDVVVDFDIQKKTGQLDAGRFYDRHLTEGTWNYDKYMPVSNHELPFVRKFHINFDADNFLNMDIDFQDISINEAYNLRFEIPDHYTIID